MEADYADVKLVADLAAKGATPLVITSEKEHFIIVPAGTELISLRDFQYAEAPVKKTGLAQMQDVPSFAGYFVRFRDEDSMIFSDPEKFNFTGILDMHKGGAGDAAGGNTKFTWNFAGRNAGLIGSV